MHSSPQILPTRRLRVAQRFMAFVAALMLLFGQSLAVGAVQSSGGAWIEVCAGEGTKMVQLDGGAPVSDCAHCDYCTIHATASLMGAPDYTKIGSMPAFSRVQFMAARVEATGGPAQYWAANRGPPLVSEENMTRKTAVSAAILSPVLRGFPWL
jgi:hypothetical protein